MVRLTASGRGDGLARVEEEREKKKREWVKTGDGSARVEEERKK